MKQLKQLKQTTIRSSYFLIYWKRWPNAKQTGSFSARLSTFEKHTERRGRRGKQHKNEVPGTYIYTYARITCCDVATTREHDVSRIDQGGSEVGFGEPFPLSFFACDGSQGWSRNVGVLSFSSLSVKPQGKRVTSATLVALLSQSKPVSASKKSCCCCLCIKPFFLPNDISSTPGVLRDSSS